MSAMDIDNDISTVLGNIRQETEVEELINLTYQLEDYSERKLWHQLTITLEDFFKICSNDLKVQLFNQFINRYTKKLNAIRLTDLLLQAFSDDNEVCLENLLELKSKVNEDYESLVYINLQISRFYILINKLEESTKILDELESKFNSINNEFNSKINSAYYLTKCQYYKYLENYNSFYSNGLLYLSTLDDLDSINKLDFGFDLSISALLGDKIYNFGELILHDILNSLKDSDYEWLYDLIMYLNSGNLKEFNTSLASSSKKYPKLEAHEVFLKQKIIIMCLVELISVKSTLNKQLSFKKISEFTGVDSNDIEHLIMKCFSLKLIKGYINQIDEVLTITWLQPRILNLDQIKTLSDHLDNWDSQVESLSKQVFTSGGSVWAGV
ncbi:26S proteasome regulatory subunit [Yamadazyma tenuis]|uniref:PCI-domain-containing protein n=1 Tax=Candida tenuis (strain ATCC 10573 / BCRC 21748 / CBS 615 / JCM 9827 / NBRC 10315 / NRRL Y-1498 / VKM Y-70) TaxID=590646 RepID=G3AYH2_CANTC|nr:PCI-domain-containing protein [Yamadazyma tenuis ATCC 10573]XP_006684783.1 uncharacterized protein CANTEDRAFT_112724 [Yamadazyma tenuis ATCC 10573]EGV66208.1 PCI-domain-containing protein [Yamadazyma tenuis ATCC 10573]EGV66209.1 hypothetical protein CANTEDRAFT_112724 [Yamadazyma tenuis ATCC 10573]WEJ95819.1 26S proteasome regulatory subunit [Yamadazyma tenuis]